MGRVLTKNQQIEQSITNIYHKTIWNKFILAIDNYKLISNGDSIAVCISGGKDSMLMAKLMQMYQRYSGVQFSITYLVMNPGYSTPNVQKIEHNAKLLELPIQVFNTNILRVVNKEAKNPCFLCAKMRRGSLYAKAKELGCNKIALGHHYNDVIETTLMGMLYGSQIQAMLPKLKSDNFEGMQLIRPLYCIREDDVISWKDYNGLEFLQCACKFTANSTVNTSKRKEVKLLIKSLMQTNPNVEKNIFHSIHNVQLDSLVEYKTKGIKHSFLEEFED